MKINGGALAAISFGTIFLWSGLKGWSVLGTVQDIVTGHQPTGSTRPGHPITPASTAPGAATSNGDTGNAVADDALRYEGHAYRYGGAPGPDGSKPWDCSSCVNWVVSHDLGYAWPGSGRYDGRTHGPTSGQWGAWFLAHGGGSTTVKRADVQAGDIICWSGHVGIAINNKQMLSARNPSSGTGVSNIDGGGSGVLICYGRLP